MSALLAVLQLQRKMEFYEKRDLISVIGQPRIKQFHAVRSKLATLRALAVPMIDRIDRTCSHSKASGSSSRASSPCSCASAPNVVPD